MAFNNARAMVFSKSGGRDGQKFSVGSRKSRFLSGGCPTLPVSTPRKARLPTPLALGSREFADRRTWEHEWGSHLLVGKVAGRNRSEGTESGANEDGDHQCSWDSEIFFGALASIANFFELDFQKFVINGGLEL